VKSQKKLFNFTYLFFLLIPIFFLFFFNNNIFSVIQNFKILKNKSDNLKKKNYEIKVLTKNLDDLKNRQEYREIIVKDKLFLRDNNEDIILYKLKSND
jgi:membrane protein insertase Oxa1/YidC/SpoIIIJ